MAPVQPPRLLASKRPRLRLQQILRSAGQHCGAAINQTAACQGQSWAANDAQPAAAAGATGLAPAPMERFIKSVVN